MKAHLLVVAGAFMLSCQHSPTLSITESIIEVPEKLTPVTFANGSWPHFLQHLPTVESAVVDYRGLPVQHQEKAAAIVNYDIGSKDLQQCADALIRLRAEYLFSQKRFNDIRFQFTSGQPYSFSDYCQGIRPIPKGNQVQFALAAAPERNTHQALRKYLDIVYAYAGTLSLNRELKETNTITVGTVILKPGSPGHCCMVIDEAITPTGSKVYKLVEGYTPAQSIYVLRNPTNGSEWHELKVGEPIRTASYSFLTYELKKFE